MGDDKEKQFCIWFTNGNCSGLNMTGFLTEQEWGVIRKIADIYFPPIQFPRNPILFRKFGPLSREK